MVLAVNQLEGKKVKFPKFPLDKKGNIDVVTNKLILEKKKGDLLHPCLFSDHMAGKRPNYSSKDRSTALTKTGCWEALISQV